MATSLLALLDDITSVLDDVATMTKVATKKTAGVLGDDLALNAQQVSGVAANRELPVVWAVAKGSTVNKAILVPAALALSALLPQAITPLLVFGGAFLCFEGVEKLAHKFLHKQEAVQETQVLLEAIHNPATNMLDVERDKIKGAVRTDFILSAEIIVISLGSLENATILTRVLTLVLVAIVMTVGVYGLVLGIVKLDDAGAALVKRGNAAARALGAGILKGAPYLMRFLSFAGTLAMFLVGGGIVAHAIAPVAALTHKLERGGGLLSFVGPAFTNLLVGVVTGAVALVLVSLLKKALVSSKSSKPKAS